MKKKLVRTVFFILLTLPMLGCLSPSLRNNKYKKWHSNGIEQRRWHDKQPFPDNCR
jgi:hypothetical protein